MIRSILTVAILLVLTCAAMPAAGAALPVTVNLTSLYSIQTFNLGENATDQAYLMLSGVAAGKPINQRIPAEQVWNAGPKNPPVTPKNPVPLWKGQLDDGQFLLLTVTLMQGKGADAALNKKFLDQLNAADQKVPGYSKPTLASSDDLKKLAQDTLNADRTVITNIKDLYAREKNTDHYGGQFTLIVWNHGGKLEKRLDPVGLTFGEHNGNDIKIYSKLKNTRNNVLVKNDKGQWEELQMEPLNDDENEVRVKELETEYVPRPNENPVRHVTDYLVGVTVLGANGMPESWTKEDVQNTIDAIHTYWNFAD